MSSVVFGEVDWNSGDVADGTGGGNRSDFLKLKEGVTTVRIMSNPTQFYQHWVEANGKKRPFNSPISEPKLVKKLEDAGFKRKAAWIVKVLDRTDGKFKLLEIGSQIYGGIKTLVQDEDWGPVSNYDVKIIRGPAGSQPLYKVSPKPKSPLEGTYKEAYNQFNDRVNLMKITQPAEPSAIKAYMGWDDDAAEPVAKKSSSQPASDDDDFFDFEQ